MKICTHPLAKQLVTQIRDIHTDSALFRVLSRRLTTILALEATEDLPTVPYLVNTPLEPMTGEKLAQSLVIVPILRAGLGMVEPFCELFPQISVGYIGLARDHQTAVADSYYCKLPPLEDKVVLLVDPMLATGGSACLAIETLKNAGASHIRLICIVAAPEGVAAVQAAHPDVALYSAALDRELSVQKYILPGLGDFGDRLYGTVS